MRQKDLRVGSTYYVDIKTGRNDRPIASTISEFIGFGEEIDKSKRRRKTYKMSVRWSYDHIVKVGTEFTIKSISRLRGEYTGEWASH